MLLRDVETGFPDLSLPHSAGNKSSDVVVVVGQVVGREAPVAAGAVAVARLRALLRPEAVAELLDKQPGGVVDERSSFTGAE